MADSGGSPGKVAARAAPAGDSASAGKRLRSSQAHNAVAGAAASVEGDTPAYICIGAAEVLKEYSLGVQRLPLDRVGVSPLNRPISGKHVHALGRRIVSVEGFCRFRYKHGWCHEPNPADPLEVTRNTNRGASCDKLLALVGNTPLYGCFAKTHLLSFLQALKSSSIYWDDNGELMLPPPGQAALLEHLEHGMFFEVLSYQAVAKAADSVKALIAADNFDAGFALGQTEVQLLKSIYDGIKVIRPPPGSTLFEALQKTVARAAGQRWGHEDVAALYNFAKVVDDQHIQFIEAFVTHHISQDEIAVRCSDYHVLSKFHPALPWTKVMLLCVQYFSQKDRWTPGPGGKSFGSQISRPEFERLQKLGRPGLAAVESFVQDVMTRYSKVNLPGVSDETLDRELPAFMVRCGKAVLLAKETLAERPLDFSKVEMKLRQNLKCETLPAWVSPPADQSKTEVAKAAPKPNPKTIVPDETPALQFKNGVVVGNAASEARAKGIVVGCEVICTRAHKGIVKHAIGTVHAIEQDVLVSWTAKSRADGSDAVVASAVPAPASIWSIAALPSNREKQPSGQKDAASSGETCCSEGKETEHRGEIPCVVGKAWVTKSLSSTSLVMRELVHAGLFHLYSSQSPTADQILLPEEGDLREIVRSAVRAQKLVLIPFADEIHNEKPEEHVPAVSLRVSVGSESLLWYLPKPSMDETELGVPVLNPFWVASCGSDERDGEKLSWKVVEWDVQLGGIQSKDPCLRLHKQGRSSMTVRMPVLINVADIPEGASVYATWPPPPV